MELKLLAMQIISLSLGALEELLGREGNTREEAQAG